MNPDPVAAPGPRAESGLTRRLGLGTATALVVGEVIGVGIFLTPAGMARSLGSPALLLAVWLTMGAVTLAGALCLGALSARTPETGGLYLHLRDAYGPRVGFLYGWQSLLVTDPGVTAALASGLATYAGSFAALTVPGQKAVGIAAILALAAVNIIGLRTGAGLLRALALLKVGLLAGVVLWGFGAGLGNWSNLLPFAARRSGSPPLFEGLAGGMMAAFFSFGGWWDLSKVAGEVRDPGRTLPRAMCLGVLLVCALYVAVSAVFLYLVPLALVSSDRGFAAQVGRVLFGAAGERVFAAIVIITVLGSLAAILMAAPRVYVAMARDGLFPPALAAIHPGLGTPTRAIGIQAVLASALVASGGFDQILGFFIFPTLAFLVLTIAAVALPGRTLAAATDAGRFSRWILPLVFVIPTLGLMGLLAARDPLRAAAGTAVVVAGIPVHALVARTRRTAGGRDESTAHRGSG